MIIETRDEALAYLNEHKIEDLIMDLGIRAFCEKPDDVRTFIIHELEKKLNSVVDRMSRDTHPVFLII
jgi:hypothetical protein